MGTSDFAVLLSGEEAMELWDFTMALKGCTDVHCSKLYDFCRAACKEPTDHNKFHNELKNKHVKAQFYEASAIKVIVPRFIYAQQ